MKKGYASIGSIPRERMICGCYDLEKGLERQIDLMCIIDRIQAQSLQLGQVTTAAQIIRWPIPGTRSRIEVIVVLIAQTNKGPAVLGNRPRPSRFERLTTKAPGFAGGYLLGGGGPSTRFARSGGHGNRTRVAFGHRPSRATNGARIRWTLGLRPFGSALKSLTFNGMGPAGLEPGTRAL